MVSAGLLEPAQLSKALDAQLQFEGRLGTNLIELGMITEEQLSAALGQQLDVPWASGAELLSIQHDVVQRLPKRAARMYRAIPISWDPHAPKTMRVAMTDPGNLRAADELAMLIGARVQPVAAAELRIAALLEQHYGIPRPPRFFIRVVGHDTERMGPTERVSTPSNDTALAEPRVEVRYLTPPPIAYAPSQLPEKNCSFASQEAPLEAAPLKAGRGLSVEEPTPRPGPVSSRQARERRSAKYSATPSLQARRGPAPPLTLALDQAPPTVKMAGPPPSDLEWVPAASEPDGASVANAPVGATFAVGAKNTGDTNSAPLASSAPHRTLPPATASTAPESTQRVSQRIEARSEGELELSSAGKRHLHAVLRAIAATDDRDEAAEQVLGYLSQSFVCAFILVVKSGVAYGWKGYAPGATEALIESIVVPLSAPSIFRLAHDRQDAYRGFLPEEGARIHSRLWKMLGCEAPSEALVAPVHVGSHLVNLIYAHPDPSRRVKPVAQANLVQLASATALAYRRAIRAAASQQVVA